MGAFQEVEGEIAITVEGGVYKQVPVYTRDGFLYAKSGAGFVRLYADGSTTKSKARLDMLSFDGALFKDKLGRLCTDAVKDAKPLPNDKAQLLLGLSDDDA